jgi:formimidoylglutamate deiminase
VVAGRLQFPGFVNAHSHAFQRALRGRTEGGDFWAWRDAMLELARGQTPKRVRDEYVTTYREMRRAGYTAVGEFHYIGLEEAKAALDAADEAGVVIVLLLAAYARGGLDRFRQDSVAAYLEQVESLRARNGTTVGVAPHSVRACPPDWLEEIARYAEGEALVLHVHASEQPREVEESLEEYGMRPIELLARTGCLGPRTTIVHATHATDGELDLVAQAGARICICPTTEANLGDGFPPLEAMLARGIELCIGSDSNVRIDPLEELRELEGIARRQLLRRNVIPPEALLRIGSKDGATSLGIDAAPDIAVDLAHSSLEGVDSSRIEAALVDGCGADVFTES